MKIRIKRLILAACALSVVEVAMAAIPKATIDRDPKNAKVAKLVVNSPEGDTTTYRCQYSWQITFNGGAETTDACEVDVPAGTKDAAMCTKQYDKRISLIVMVQSNCKPT
ncbi:MAG TPA: hypothetical protein VGM97_02245 [Steroidobacteraceae bacterium]|jgi:hypothetical protein